MNRNPDIDRDVSQALGGIVGNMIKGFSREKVYTGGRITAPTPAKTPSTIIDRSTPSGRVLPTQLPAARVAASSASAGTVDQEKTAWNIRNMTAARINGPPIG